NCSVKDLEIAVHFAKELKCNILFHAGDMKDEHIGLSIFNDFQVYLALTSSTNKSIKTIDYVHAHAPNWHFYNSEKLNVIHFYYDWFGKQKDLSFLLTHKMGIKCLQTPLDELEENSKSAFLFTMIDEIEKKVLPDHHWLNYIIMGHSHHVFTYSHHGIKLVNPGEWEQKKCFAIINPGPLNVSCFSLTEDNTMIDGLDKLTMFIKNSLN
ncbi:hypothetical protein ACFL1Y_01675, partial [Patescibacteria group bacterium]